MYMFYICNLINNIKILKFICINCSCLIKKKNIIKNIVLEYWNEK